ncbi:hypothetical protein QNI16_19645 [Cytophagaceae bacterium YF14B1]|uniref:Tetratricopeptide repeat protein n=1 Tax=Xanthocytophaga flava TaxID=3048013 RepID=A0AAE3QTU9_9BACT|nr:hypothetical protein [Xanthocytophaga flavus]MDJ1482724.1 hypothetical protein [Xanthocytophaga flavus]
MGVFDFFKNKKDKPESNQPDLQLQAEIDRFENEIFATTARYISQPGVQVNIRARHSETNEVIPFAVGFPEQFNEWRTVQSLADRRGIIYRLLDSQVGNQLALWQVMERFNDDRYPERALQIATEHKQEADEQDPDFWNALARTNFILTHYEEAERNCQKALELDSTSIRSKRILADTLHVMGKHDKAHELYQEILAKKLPKNQPANLPLQDLLGFDGDIVNSPIYAIGWLKSDENVTPEVWNWAVEEFYYSPHFRTEHAFYLIQNKDVMKGFAKLLHVSKEMPWFKDAVVNSYHIIEQLGLSDKMQDERTRLKGIMDIQNWN